MSDDSYPGLVNTDAENALLRSIYIDNQTYIGVSEFLHSECFSDAGRGVIFEQMVDLMEKGEDVNSLTLSRCILGNEDIGYTSASEYLDGVRVDEVSIRSAGKCGRIIHDLYLRRKLAGLAHGLIEDVYAQGFGGTTRDLIEAIDHQLYELSTECDCEGGFMDFSTAIVGGVHEVEAAFKREDTLSRLNTGISALDKVMGGLRSGELTILAGRHGMGTTSLARTIAYNVAYSHHHQSGKEGAKVGFFSLDLPVSQIAKPVLCDLASVPLSQVQNGFLSTEEFTNFVVTSQDMHRIPLFIDDTPNLSLSALRTRAQRLKRQHDMGLIVVDYIQLLSGSSSQPDQSQKQTLQTNLRRLKMLAAGLDVPVLIVYHLPESVGDQMQKRPCIEDLHELEGALSYVDSALLLYREQHDLEHAEPVRGPAMNAWKFRSHHKRWKKCIEETEGTAEVRVAHLRGGASVNVKLHFDKGVSSFK